MLQPDLLLTVLKIPDPGRRVATARGEIAPSGLNATSSIQDSSAPSLSDNPACVALNSCLAVSTSHTDAKSPFAVASFLLSLLKASPSPLTPPNHACRTAPVSTSDKLTPPSVQTAARCRAIRTERDFPYLGGLRGLGHLFNHLSALAERNAAGSDSPVLCALGSRPAGRDLEENDPAVLASGREVGACWMERDARDRRRHAAACYFAPARDIPEACTSCRCCRWQQGGRPD